MITGFRMMDGSLPLVDVTVSDETSHGEIISAALDGVRL